MKWIGILFICLFPLLSCGQHFFGAEGGANISLGNSNKVGYYGIGSYSNQFGEYWRMTCQAEFTVNTNSVTSFGFESGEFSTTAMSIAPVLELGIRKRFWMLNGLAFSKIFAANRTRIPGNIFGQPLSTSILLPIDTHRIGWLFGFRLEKNNFAINLKYNRTILDGSRILVRNSNNTVISVADTDYLQLGLSYRIDPIKELSKLD